MPPGHLRLLLDIVQRRFDLNRRQLMSLRGENLLQNHRFEAGLGSSHSKPQSIHCG